MEEGSAAFPAASEHMNSAGRCVLPASQCSLHKDGCLPGFCLLTSDTDGIGENYLDFCPEKGWSPLV